MFQVSKKGLCRGVSWLAVAVVSLMLFGCGGGGGDAGGGGALVTVTGIITVPTATTRQAGNTVPDATVRAYLWFNLNQHLAEARSDSNGRYALSLPADVTGKDLIIIATKQTSGGLLRLATICADVPQGGRENVDLNALTTFATEEIVRIREQEGLTDLLQGGFASILADLRSRVEWDGNLLDVLPQQIGGGLRPEGLQQQVQQVVSRYRDALKGGSANADISRARLMVQSMRDMSTALVSSGDTEAITADEAVQEAADQLEHQLDVTGEFSRRLDDVLVVVDALRDYPPGVYEVSGPLGYYVHLERVGDSPDRKTWEIRFKAPRPSENIVLTITTNREMENFQLNPIAGEYRLSAVRGDTVAYTATLQPVRNEANRVITLNAQMRLQDPELTQPVTFNGALQMNMAQMPSGNEEILRVVRAVLNGSFTSPYGSAQVTNLVVEFDPDSSASDSIKNVTLQKLEVQLLDGDLSLVLEGVNLPMMKLVGGGQTPSRLNVSRLELSVREDNSESMSLVLRNVEANLVQYEYIYNGRPKTDGAIKNLSAKVLLNSNRMRLEGEVVANWDNPLPPSQFSKADNNLRSFPRGNILIRGRMTPRVGKPSQAELEVNSQPNATPPKITARATFMYGAEQTSVTYEVRLRETGAGVEGDYHSATITHAPTGMRAQISHPSGQPTRGTIITANGAKVADIGEARELGLPDLGRMLIVKYADGSFEALESLIL